MIFWVVYSLDSTVWYVECYSHRLMGLETSQGEDCKVSKDM